MISLISAANADHLKSGSQIARVITEGFVGEYGFCPACGSGLKHAVANSRALDFECKNCDEGFELKSKNEKIGAKIVNGAHDALMGRVMGLDNPNLYLLHYDKAKLLVKNLLIIPRYFFTPNLIEIRKPLGPKAKRAGWVGCNILVGAVPEMGRIHYIKDEVAIKPEIILKKWQETTFLLNTKNIESRGWLLDTLNCVDKIGNSEFTLDELYKFEPELKKLHPENNHIKDKLRQQLQFLRDKGVIEFLGRGNYRRQT